MTEIKANYYTCEEMKDTCNLCRKANDTRFYFTKSGGNLSWLVLSWCSPNYLIITHYRKIRCYHVSWTLFSLYFPELNPLQFNMLSGSSTADIAFKDSWSISACFLSFYLLSFPHSTHILSDPQWVLRFIPWNRPKKRKEKG